MDQIPENTEVLATVLKEIENVGSLSKENFEVQQREFKEFRDSVDEQEKKKDILTDEKIGKLSTVLSARQDEIDKAIQKRLDSIEVAVQRPGGALNDEAKNSPEYKDARDFQIACLVNPRSGSSVNYEDAKNLDVNVEQFKAYSEIFEKYMRSNQGNQGFGPEEMRALNVGSNQDGGYTVLPFMSNMVTEQIRELDPMRQICDVMTISTDAVEWSTDLDEIGSAWEAETVNSGESDTPKIGERRVPVHKLVSRPQATQQFIEDSVVNVQAWLSGKAANKFARDQGSSYINGDGVTKSRGILTYTSGTSVTNQIEQVNMGSDTALTPDGFIDVMYSLVEALMFKGTWLMNRTTVAAAMKLKNGEGDYLWRPGMQAGQPSTILGSPVRMSTTMPSIAQNALAVAFAAWKEAYLIVDRLGMSLKIDPYTADPYIKYILRARGGGDVKNFQALKLGKISA